MRVRERIQAARASRERAHRRDEKTPQLRRANPDRRPPQGSGRGAGTSEGFRTLDRGGSDADDSVAPVGGGVALHRRERQRTGADGSTHECDRPAPAGYRCHADDVQPPAMSRLALRSRRQEQQEPAESERSEAQDEQSGPDRDGRGSDQDSPAQQSRPAAAWRLLVRAHNGRRGASARAQSSARGAGEVPPRRLVPRHTAAPKRRVYGEARTIASRCRSKAVAAHDLAERGEVG